MSTSPRRLGAFWAIAASVLALVPSSAGAAPGALPGRISGLFTGVAGRPLPNVFVFGDCLTNPAQSFITVTRADGRFAVLAQPGQYKIRFQAPGVPEQWATGKESERLAEVITVESGGEVLLEEKALPTGRLEGRLLDARGRSVAFAAAVVENPGLDRFFQATTDSQGRWFLTVWPGTYKVRFETTTQVQWAHGKISPESADPVAVAADKTTVVNEKLAAPGSLAVEAIDTHTGEAVMSFCVDAHTQFMFAFACTEDGIAEFDELGPGNYTVLVTDAIHLDNATPEVVITSGQAATTTARLGLGATIAVTVTDAVTGEPVDGVCLMGRPAQRAPEYGEFLGTCTDFTGTITLERVVPDRYVFFASVVDGLHGSQWVGPEGGVGAQAAAQVVTAAEGTTTELRVLLDPPGAIAGVITDEQTGVPLENAEVTIGDFAVATGADGAYLFDSLGPYEWVVYFGHVDYAGQWSGGEGNRITATPIPVAANETTPYDVALGRQTKLTGRITGSGGQPPDLAEVTVVNAKTFDTMHHAVVGADGVYTAPLTGPQEVKLLVIALIDGRAVTMWYPESADFAHGRTISVPTFGTTVLDIPVS